MEFAGPRIAATPTRDVRVVRLGGLSIRVTASTGAHPTLRTEAREAIVILEGVGMPDRHARRLHRELDAHGRVLAIDLPGFGGRRAPDSDVAAMATALGEVLDRVGAASVHLVAPATGVRWVVELAAQRPELVSRVVIVGAVADPRLRSALCGISAPLLVLPKGIGPFDGMRWSRERRGAAPAPAPVDSALQTVASAIASFVQYGTRMSDA